jgi:hypothetical protein
MKKVLLSAVVFVSGYAFSMDETAVNRAVEKKIFAVQMFSDTVNVRKSDIMNLLEIFEEPIGDFLGGSTEEKREIAGKVIVTALLLRHTSLGLAGDFLISLMEEPGGLGTFWVERQLETADYDPMMWK